MAGTAAFAEDQAFRWCKPLETGVYGTIEEAGCGRKINCSYVSRILRLTLLAPTSSRRFWRASSLWR